MKEAKYDYELVLQTNHGYGWDDECFFEAKSNGLAKDRDNVKLTTQLYHEYASGHVRVIFRRTKKEEAQA